MIEGLEGLPTEEAASLRRAIERLCFNNAHELGERARDLFQQRGYFKATIEDPKIVARNDSQWPAPAEVLLSVFPGRQYRLREITFTGNKAVSNNAALRSLIPHRDGDVLDLEKIRLGIKRLKDVYGELGFINFTPVPDFTFEEDHGLVDMKIDIEEGKQYVVSQVKVQARARDVRKLADAWIGKVGDVYNSRAVELFFQRNRRLFPPDATVERNVAIAQNNERALVTIYVNLCASDKDCAVAYVSCRPELTCVPDSAGIPQFVR